MKKSVFVCLVVSPGAFLLGYAEQSGCLHNPSAPYLAHLMQAVEELTEGQEEEEENKQLPKRLKFSVRISER